MKLLLVEDGLATPVSTTPCPNRSILMNSKPGSAAAQKIVTESRDGPDERLRCNTAFCEQADPAAQAHLKYHKP
ncbi:MAG: hypothetical protein GZ093_03240 [Rhodoferax sp.]|uniref:hypothetical protein n=1 Tax=Rhodoferax sp. TaxID=50421 RepID=UPI0013FEDB9C|nr:hypothetical protein [Rhodoferax sp.]NDP37751.1 hypothetical protein [Rhodoferax sp.]